MSLDITTFSTKIVSQLSASSSLIEVTTGFDEVVACLDTPATLKARVFTATTQECFIISGYDNVNRTLTVNRADGAGLFPAGSCICIDQVILGECPQAPEDQATNVIDPSALISLFKNVGGIVLEEQDGQICIGLAPVSTDSKEHCGLKYNKFGLVTESTGECPIPEPEEKCCDATDGGGGDADSISVVLKQNSTLSGDNLSDVICSIEAMISSVSSSVPSNSLSGIKVGKGIGITGLPSGCPTLSLDPVITGGADVTYAGFTFNTCGQLINYVAPTAAETISKLIAGGGIVLSPDATDASCVTVSSSQATNETLGGVYVAADSDVIAGSADGEHLASIDAICNLITTKSVDEAYVTATLEDYPLIGEMTTAIADLENKIKTTVGQDDSNDTTATLPADWFTVPGSAPASLSAPDGSYIKDIVKDPTSGEFTVTFREICKAD